MTLQEAIAADDVNQLYSLIERDKDLLDHGSESPFPNTPLHDAANQGKTKVAVEIAILKPSFTRKLNRGGHSPMHLALQKKHYHTARALMSLNPELIRVRGRGGITPLHFVAGEKGDNEQENVELLELLVQFLNACKSSIEDLTSQCETVVHIVVKRDDTETFKVLFGWLKRAHLTKILNWKDQDGNTALHIAMTERHPEIINLLVEYTDVDAKNFQDETPLEIFLANPCGSPNVAERFRRQGNRARLLTPTFSLSQFFSRDPTNFETYTNFFKVRDKSAREVILVVSALIAAATYQAALTPPGGYWQDSSSNSTANSTVVAANSSSIAHGKPHQAGDIIMSGWRLSLYTTCNLMAFFNSIATIWATALELEATSVAFISLPLLCTAYFISLLIQAPISIVLTLISVGLLFEIFILVTLCLRLFTRLKDDILVSTPVSEAEIDDEITIQDYAN